MLVFLLSYLLCDSFWKPCNFDIKYSKTNNFILSLTFSSSLVFVSSVAVLFPGFSQIYLSFILLKL